MAGKMPVSRTVTIRTNGRPTHSTAHSKVLGDPNNLDKFRSSSCAGDKLDDQAKKDRQSLTDQFLEAFAECRK